MSAVLIKYKVVGDPEGWHVLRRREDGPWETVGRGLAHRSKGWALGIARACVRRDEWAAARLGVSVDAQILGGSQ